jgi:LEA14-like dessication related protein
VWRLLAMLATLFWLATAAHAQQSAPEVSIASIDSIALQGRTAILDLTLAIRNPNGLALPLQKLRFQSQFNGLDVAQGDSTAPVTIPAQGQAQVPVRVNVDSATMLTLLATLPPDGTVNYLISGTAEIGLTMLRIPFSHSGTVRLALK